MIMTLRVRMKQQNRSDFGIRINRVDRVKRASLNSKHTHSQSPYYRLIVNEYAHERDDLEDEEYMHMHLYGILFNSMWERILSRTCLGLVLLDFRAYRRYVNWLLLNGF